MCVPFVPKTKGTHYFRVVWASAFLFAGRSIEADDEEGVNDFCHRKRGESRHKVRVFAMAWKKNILRIYWLAVLVIASPGCLLHPYSQPVGTWAALAFTATAAFHPPPFKFLEFVYFTSLTTITYHGGKKNSPNPYLHQPAGNIIMPNVAFFFVGIAESRHSTNSFVLQHLAKNKEYGQRRGKL